MHRRDVLKASVPLITAGLAGCSGGTVSSDGGNTPPATEESQFWPPGNNQVEALVTVGTGSTRYVLPHTWTPYKNEHYPAGVTERIVNRPGAGGIVAQNEVNSAPKDGGTIFSGAASILVFNSLKEESNFSASDFVPFQDIRALTQSIQVSAQVVDRHFAIDWDTFVNKLKEEEWNLGSASPQTEALWYYVADQEPDLSREDIQVINFSGGAELRAAILRGEVHVNFGPTTTNYQRTDSYWTQFVALDSRYSGMMDLVEGVIKEDPIYLSDTSFPTGAAETVVSLVTNTHTNFLPKGTPEETIEIHEQVCRDAESDELISDVEDVLGEGLFYNVIGDESRAAYDSTRQAIIDNRDILNL